jgi:hypothetical protein
MVKDDPNKVWDVVDDFFMEVENQLELDPDFIKELSELSSDENYVLLNLDVKELDDLFEEECGEDYSPSHIEVLKEYIEHIKKEE